MTAGTIMKVIRMKIRIVVRTKRLVISNLRRLTVIVMMM